MINKFKLFWNANNFNKFLTIMTVFVLPISFGIASAITIGSFIDFIGTSIILIMFGAFILLAEI